MKVFISWSGSQSKKYAEAIRDWLPSVLQLVTPYFTPTDIDKGSRWSTDIANELASSEIGLICVTRENLHADWILFEAGALSKSLGKSLVCPILFDLSNTDLSGPLKQFQLTEFDRTEMSKLIAVVNNKLGDHKLGQKTLESVFNKWWPDLETKVSEIARSVVQPKTPVRTDRQLIEEILTLTRQSAGIRSRFVIPPKAAQDLAEAVVELHDHQAAGKGGYQDALDVLAKAKDPLNYIMSKYKGVSDEMDKLVERVKGLDYKAPDNDGFDDDDIPF